jgi:hypothetical protein
MPNNRNGDLSCALYAARVLKLAWVSTLLLASLVEELA